MTPSCELYLEDPEHHAEHLAQCPSCRRLAAGLELAPDVKRVPEGTLARLPVAPWEGAAYRSWGIVIAVGIVILGAAAALFLLGGVAPLEGFAASLRALAPRFHLMSVASSVAKLLQHAPIKFHLFVLTAFVIVNVLFVLLLRRPPKGYDVTVR